MLRVASDPAWLKAVLGHFDDFLIDHAANERKASANALSFVVHYPDRPELVTEMIAIALEELEHFQQVTTIIQARGLCLGPDIKDRYVNALLKQVRTDRDGRLRDRLILGAIIEARGCERFALLGQALDDPELAAFYRELARSEAEHRERFLELARQLFPGPEVEAELELWLDREAEALAALPPRALLH